jgi:hypothetical protein
MLQAHCFWSILLPAAFSTQSPSYSAIEIACCISLPPLQAHGFWGILLLAAYPNAAFDLCGICCGHFLMPFWEFFGATLIGKGGIKIAGQTAFFVAIFRQQTRERVFDFLERLVPDVLPFLHLNGMTPMQAAHQLVNQRIREFQPVCPLSFKMRLL